MWAKLVFFGVEKFSNGGLRRKRGKQIGHGFVFQRAKNLSSESAYGLFAVGRTLLFFRLTTKVLRPF